MEYEQKPLIVEALEEVLHAVGARTGGYKALCCAICPEHAGDPDEAAKKVARKLNPSAKEVFSDDDMDRAIAWGKLHNCHLLKWWKDGRQGYQNSEPKDAKSEILVIREQQKHLSEQQLELQQRVERLTDEDR